MVTAQNSKKNGYLPGGREWRAADLIVLALLIAALVAGALLRQSHLNATQSASFEGLTFDAPRGAVVHSSKDEYEATARNGLTLSVQKLPAPPIGTDDTAALAATRAIDLGRQRTLFQSAATDQVSAAGKNAEVIHYQYVESNSNQFFARGLRVIDGNELLIPDGGSFYALSLEAPSERRADLDALWPRIQSSVRLGG
jgi:hypothetical protein